MKIGHAFDFLPGRFYFRAMWQELLLTREQYEQLENELERVVTIVHRDDFSENFMMAEIGNPGTVVFTPGFYMILCELIPMLRTLKPTPIDLPRMAGWRFIYGDEKHFITLIRA